MTASALGIGVTASTMFHVKPRAPHTPPAHILRTLVRYRASVPRCRDGGLRQLDVRRDAYSAPHRRGVAGGHRRPWELEFHPHLCPTSYRSEPSTRGHLHLGRQTVPGAKVFHVKRICQERSTVAQAVPNCSGLDRSRRSSTAGTGQKVAPARRREQLFDLHQVKPYRLQFRRGRQRIPSQRTASALRR